VAVAVVVLVATGVALWLSRRPAPPATVIAPVSILVPLQIRFDGEVTLLVDGREVGAFRDEVRLSLPAGPHRLGARRGADVDTREVLLLPGTTPTFDLSPSSVGLSP
jgi:hypothetical protein